MTNAHLGVFDNTLQKTYAWVDEVAGALRQDDRQQAYLALRAVLHTLRDRLTVEEAAHLGAQLPMLVRGFYYEGWRPAADPRRYDRQAFLARVAEEIAPGGMQDPERATAAVLETLAQHVTAGEIEDVKAQLPEDLQGLWPA